MGITNPQSDMSKIKTEVVEITQNRKSEDNTLNIKEKCRINLKLSNQYKERIE
jgi:hypothetical protein